MGVALVCEYLKGVGVDIIKPDVHVRRIIGRLGYSKHNPATVRETMDVCKAIAENDHCFSVIGGGDSAAAAKQFGYKDSFSHVSTGGGASLEMIENDGHLPGIDVIEDK